MRARIVGRLGAQGFPESRAVLEDESGASNGPEYGQRVGSYVNISLEHWHPANIKINFRIFILYRIIWLLWMPTNFFRIFFFYQILLWMLYYRFSKDCFMTLT